MATKSQTTRARRRARASASRYALAAPASHRRRARSKRSVDSCPSGMPSTQVHTTSAGGSRRSTRTRSAAVRATATSRQVPLASAQSARAPNHLDRPRGVASAANTSGGDAAISTSTIDVDTTSRPATSSWRWQTSTARRHSASPTTSTRGFRPRRIRSAPDPRRVSGGLTRTVSTRGCETKEVPKIRRRPFSWTALAADGLAGTVAVSAATALAVRSACAGPE